MEESHAKTSGLTCFCPDIVKYVKYSPPIRTKTASIEGFLATIPEVRQAARKILFYANKMLPESVKNYE